MFDFLRNLTKSAEEKRQEMITAYLDDALSTAARTRFEAELAQDPSLQADLERERAVKQALTQLPQRRTPRNFTLDPTKYGRPAKQPLVQAYPVLRTATGLAAFFFIFALVAGLYTSGGSSEPLSGIAIKFPSAQTETVTVEVTRVVTETIVEEGEPVIVTQVVTETVVELVEVEPEPESEIAADAVEVEEETVVEEEMAEEEAMEEAAAPEEPAAAEELADDGTELFNEGESADGEATAQAPIAAGGTPDDAPEGDTAASTAPEPTPTLAVVATATEKVLPTATTAPTEAPSLTPMPTATTSVLPRPSATSALNRSIEMTAEADEEIADSNFAQETETTAEDTAVTQPAEQDEQSSQLTQPSANFGLILIVSLFFLFIILLAVTLVARRQL